MSDKNIIIADKIKNKLQISELKNKSSIISKSLGIDLVADQINLIDINSQSILQGIIWSEILGKPKSLRKGR